MDTLALLKDQLAALERYFDAHVSSEGERFAALRQDVHMSVTSIGIEQYEMKPVLKSIAATLERADRRLANLEQRAVTVDSERAEKERNDEIERQQARADLQAQLAAIWAMLRRLAWGLLLLGAVVLLILGGMYL